MPDLTLPAALYQRLTLAARRLGRSPEDCALGAITAFVEDCEEAAGHARALSGGETMMRPPDGFYD